MTRGEMIERIIRLSSVWDRATLEMWDDEGLESILSCYAAWDVPEKRECICGAKHTSRPDWHLKSCDDYRKGK